MPCGAAHRWIVVASLVASALGFVWAGRARAQDHELGLRAELNGGYDTNPLLSVSPAARSASDPAIDGPGPGAVSGLVADAYALWGRDVWLGVGADTDARVYSDGSVRHDSSLSLLTGLAAGAHRVSLSAFIGRYDASFGSDNALYAALATSLRLSLSETWSLALRPHGAIRNYSVGEQSNWDGGGALELALRVGAWVASLETDLERRQSTDPLARRTQLSPSFTVRRRLGRLTVSLGYTAYARWFDQGGQDGIEHTAEARAQLQLSAALAAVVRLSGGVARGQDAALHYERLSALLGLAITLGARAVPVDETLPDRSEQGPARLDSAGTTITLCREGAHAVAVVGSFNDWSADAGRMTAIDSGDCFAITLQLPPGRYRYQWQIDGQLVVPEDAPSYADDGFGGRDAVLIVPE